MTRMRQKEGRNGGIPSTVPTYKNKNKKMCIHMDII